MRVPPITESLESLVLNQAIQATALFSVVLQGKAGEKMQPVCMPWMIRASPSSTTSKEVLDQPESLGCPVSNPLTMKCCLYWMTFGGPPSLLRGASSVLDCMTRPALKAESKTPHKSESDKDGQFLNFNSSSIVPGYHWPKEDVLQGENYDRPMQLHVVRRTASTRTARNV